MWLGLSRATNRTQTLWASSVYLPFHLHPCLLPSFSLRLSFSGLSFHLSCSPWAPDYILTLAQSPLLACWNCSSRRAQLDLTRVLWTAQLLLCTDNYVCLCPFSSVLRLLLWRVHFSFVLNSFFVPHFGLENLQNCVSRTFLSFLNIIIISLKHYCLGFILPDEIQNEHVKFHYISHVFLWE